MNAMVVLSRFLIASGLVALLLLAPPVRAGTLLTERPMDASDQGLSVHLMDAWQVTCESKAKIRNCGFSSEAKSEATAKGETALVRMALSSLRQKNGKTVLVLNTPLDLLISKGIEFRVDKQKPLKLAFRSCHRSGCVAPFVLDERMGRLFRKGNRLTVRVHDLKAAPIDVEFSLSGFTAASRFADSPSGS